MILPLGKEELAQQGEAFSAWLDRELAENPAVDSVEGNPVELWWYVRVKGEAKDFTAVKYQLGQRTLAYESYVMPFPGENVTEFLELILRLNAKMYGGAFVIGSENGIYLSGQIDARAASNPDEMDRVLGSMFDWSESNFSRLIRLGYASRF